jgi:hypothetical protein
MSEICNYPHCNCPFDMGPSGRCLIGLERAPYLTREEVMNDTSEHVPQPAEPEASETDRAHWIAAVAFALAALVILVGTVRHHRSTMAGLPPPILMDPALTQGAAGRGLLELQDIDRQLLAIGNEMQQINDELTRLENGATLTRLENSPLNPSAGHPSAGHPDTSQSW